MCRTGTNQSSLWTHVLVFVVLLLGAAACGSDDGDTTDDDATVTTPSSDADADADADPTGAGPGETDEEPGSVDDADSGEQVEGEVGADGAEPRFELEGELPLPTAEVNEMLTFVEEATGRPFTSPPGIVVQNVVDFEAGLADRVADGLERAADDIDISARSFQALGLSEQTGDELLTNLERFSTSSDTIAGYYDPEVDRLYMPLGAEVDDMFRAVLVHELVHALDDQYIDMQAIIDDIEADPYANEINFARIATVEGRATAVQQDWMTANSVVPPQPELTADILAVPPIVVNDTSFPYAFGSVLVQASGGAAETWDLYEDLPASSEEIMFPTSGPAEAEELVDVAAPTADGPELFTGEFGAADLALWLLSDSLEPDPVVAQGAIAAADGWAGGRQVLWGDESESCVRIALAADTDTDLAEIEQAIQVWVDAAAGRSVENTAGVVTATGCAPYRS